MPPVPGRRARHCRRGGRSRCCWPRRRCRHPRRRADPISATVTATADRAADAGRLPRASHSSTGRIRQYTGRDPAGHRSGADQPAPGDGPRPDAGGPNRRQQHRRDLVAGPAYAPPGGVDYRAHSRLAADHPGPGRRSARQADPGHQPGGRPAGDRRRRGPGAACRASAGATSRPSRSATSPTCTGSSPGTATAGGICTGLAGATTD